jgi:hypothetical protein
MARAARRCRRTGLLEALVIALCMFASRVGAQDEAIALDTSACEVDASELRRILALERRLEDGARLQVELRCDRERAWLRAGPTTREIELASVPEALRARLLALAIAELRPTPPPAAISRPAGPQRFRLWLAAHGLLSSLAAAGAQLGFTTRLNPWSALTSGAAFTQGSLAIDRGELRVRHASVHAGLAVQREGRLTMMTGAGVRAGWLGLRGLPSEARVRGQRFDTWFVGPTLFGSAALGFATHGFVLLGLELTHSIREVHAEVRGGRTRTLSPWLGGASLGVGASW